MTQLYKYRCDRCGSMFDAKDEYSTITVNLTTKYTKNSITKELGSQIKDYDFCLSCREQRQLNITYRQSAVLPFVAECFLNEKNDD